MSVHPYVSPAATQNLRCHRNFPTAIRRAPADEKQWLQSDRSSSGAGSQRSFVESLDAFPVGNIGEDALLDCSFQSSGADGKRADGVSVTWEKAGLSGVVFDFQNQAAQLKNQNPRFKDRAQLFLRAVAAGNASLLLRSVGLQDAGVYQCSVSAPSGQGSVSVHLRVAAYSSPRFSRSENTLRGEAQRWYPKPNVTWTDHDGHTLNGSTQFLNNSAGIFRLVTRLDPVQMDDTYICLIRNHLVTSISQATVTEKEITARTHFTFSPAPSLLPLHLVLTAPLHLWASCLLI
ncbi:hypothetical protein AAFF_G00279980 [Aldrovandia affinis]|uniref:Ig-like domain-containing protein n=1 Tax=Aldrovandia affinis TaxID=143900 RepID=A0AAD7SR97_9TELE|nr:hypothetical protein AAFF_G00279980 [Aldrovandia affinis]